MRRSRQVLALACSVALLWGCGGPATMARSSVAGEPRPLYADEDSNAEFPDAERFPAPVAPTVEEALPTDASTGAGEAAPYPESEDEAPSIDMESARSSEVASSTGDVAGRYVPPPNLGWSVAVEPLPWVPLDPAPIPAAPRRVLLATLELPPGRTIFPPVSACQDVLVYVQDGALEATGTGIGTTDAPATLYAGDAVRFGPEGDGRLTNRSGTPALALVIIARAADAGAPLYTAPVDAGLCERALVADPVVRPLRLASTATTAPLRTPDGHLEVRILLDVDGTASAHAGLALLEGDANADIASHRHEVADEVLYVESGAGTLYVGSERVAVHDGSVLYIPHGVEHRFEPAGSSPLRVLQLYAPSGPEQRFRGL